MNLQNEIMLEYLTLRGNPSLRRMNVDTGIQTTRLHRLMNGAKMKMDEYEVFVQKVMEIKGVKIEMVELVRLSMSKLSNESLQDVVEVMTRKISLSNLKHSRGVNV